MDPFEVLPGELNEAILSWLPSISDVMRCSLVCSQWKEAVSSHSLWRSIYAKHFGSPDAIESDPKEWKERIVEIITTFSSFRLARQKLEWACENSLHVLVGRIFLYVIPHLSTFSIEEAARLGKSKAKLINATVGGWTPLGIAITYGNLELMQHLINNNVQLRSNLNIPIKVTPTATRQHVALGLFFDYARQKGHLEEIMKTLQKRRESFLVEAMRYNKTQLVSLLINTPEYIQYNPLDGLVDSLAPLHYAVRQRNMDSIQILLDAGADITQTNIDGDTCLHMLASSKHPMNCYVLEILLNKGLKPGIQNGLGCTALHCAAEHQLWDELNLLLDFTPMVDINLPRSSAMENDPRDETNLTVLHVAARMYRVDVVKRLLEKGADPNIMAEFGNSVHSVLAKSSLLGGHQIESVIEILRLLVAHGADINMIGHHGTPLHMALYMTKSKTTQLTLVKELLALGADVNLICIPAGEDATATSPVLEAAEHGRLDMLKLFKKLKVRFDRVASQPGLSCLSLATKLNNIDAVQTILTHPGFDPEKNFGVALEGQNALARACRNGNLRVVRWLVEEKQEINGLKTSITCPAAVAYNQLGYPNLSDFYPFTAGRGAASPKHLNAGYCSSVPLVVAAGGGHIPVVEYLIKQGANVNASTGPHGCSALAAALASQKADMAMWLLEHTKANVNAKDVHGNTPLHLLGMCVLEDTGDWDEVIKKIIDLGGMMTLRNIAGETPGKSRMSDCDSVHVIGVVEDYKNHQQSKKKVHGRRK